MLILGTLYGMLERRRDPIFDKQYQLHMETVGQAFIHECLIRPTHVEYLWYEVRLACLTIICQPFDQLPSISIEQLHLVNRTKKPRNQTAKTLRSRRKSP